MPNRDGAQDEGFFYLVSRQIYQPKNGSANDFYRNVNEPISALLKTVNQILCHILSLYSSPVCRGHIWHLILQRSRKAGKKSNNKRIKNTIGYFLVGADQRRENCTIN